MVRDGFNLSFESLTSPAALRILRDLPRTDRALWDKISYTILDDEPEDLPTTQADQDPALNDPFDPFDADEAADYDDDTAIDAREFMARILEPSASTAAGPGLADEMEPGELEIPSADESGRGKRRRLANRLYDDYLAH